MSQPTQKRPLQSVPTGGPPSTPGGGASGHPSRSIIDAKTASALVAALNQAREHELKGSDAYYEAAQTVYNAIRKTSKWPGTLDKIRTARRVRKLIIGAGAAVEEASTNLAVAAREVQRVQAAGKAAGGKNDFDANA